MLKLSGSVLVIRSTSARQTGVEAYLVRARARARARVRGWGRGRGRDRDRDRDRRWRRT